MKNGCLTSKVAIHGWAADGFAVTTMFGMAAVRGGVLLFNVKQQLSAIAHWACKLAKTETSRENECGLLFIFFKGH